MILISHAQVSFVIFKLNTVANVHDSLVSLETQFKNNSFSNSTFHNFRNGHPVLKISINCQLFKYKYTDKYNYMLTNIIQIIS